MDDKIITAVSTSLALMQIQVNALVLLLDQQHPAASLRDHFQRLVSEGVEVVGLETMEGIKSRIQEGILQQEQTEPGSNGNSQR
jgi:hypothetical protein